MRPPIPVVVVVADRPREAVPWPVEIDRRCFAPAVAEDGCSRALLRRHAVIDARDLLHHLLPAELVGEVLRQRTVVLPLRHYWRNVEYRLVAEIVLWRKDGARNRRQQGTNGYDGRDVCGPAPGEPVARDPLKP